LVYIHRNPINHGITKKLNDYKWSSYNSFDSRDYDKKQMINLIDVYSIERANKILNDHFEDLENFKFCHLKPTNNRFLDEIEFGD